METIANWIDRAKIKIGVESDNAFAIKIGKSRATISDWKSGRSLPGSDTVYLIAEMAQMDVSRALVLREYWATHNETREAFARIFHKLAGCFIAILFGSILFFSESANALENKEKLDHHTRGFTCDSLHYVVLKDNP